MTYLIRPLARKRGPKTVVRSEAPGVEFGERRRTKSVHEVPGFGAFREVERVGADRKLLVLHARDGTHGYGRSLHATYIHIPATRDGVNAQVRTLRDQEAPLIAEAEAKVEEARRVLLAAKAELDEAIREAFSKGHKVPLKDLVTLAEDRERARTHSR